LTMVAAIGKRTQEHHDTLQERDIHRFSTLKLLCQDRHASYNLLDNSMFRPQHFNWRCTAHLISLTIVSRSSPSSSAWMSCGMALSSAIGVPAGSVRGSPATPNWTAPETTAA